MDPRHDRREPRHPGRCRALKRIVVAVDPALSVTETSNATGIIVAGVGTDNHGYILEDLSSKLSQVEWAQKAIAAYRRHKADRIVAEANQGGAMVEATLRAVDRSVPVRLVHASRGKITRAEPISALYEQHRVHHAGLFAELEDEMTTYEPGSQNSPDRLDALVWALTELMVGYECPMSFCAPLVGPGRTSFANAYMQGVLADHSPGIPYDTGGSMPPGGWRADDPRAWRIRDIRRIWAFGLVAEPEELAPEAPAPHVRPSARFRGPVR